MKPSWRSAPALAIVLLAAGLAGSCRAKTDRDLIAGVIDDLAAQVEKKKAAGLVAHLSQDYRDFEGRDREATRAMAEDFFRRYRGIKARVLSSRILTGTGDAPSADFDVALYSGVGAALRKAVGFSGENYRVSCEFRREGAWRIASARWEYVPLEGLFPESLKILRELFPDL